MRKKQLRRPDTPQDPAGSAPEGPRKPPAAAPRPKRVRNRLIGSVALCALAVLGAGAPAVFSASQDATEAQELVDRAETNRRAVALAHSLADERDSMVEYVARVAAGRDSSDSTGVSEAQRARVDRQGRDLRAGAPREVRQGIDALPRTRQRALTGKSGVLATHQAYTETIDALRAISLQISRDLPERAKDATAAALPDLAGAAEQASAERGLLQAALAGHGSQPALTSQAQQARARERAALTAFDETAGTTAQETYSTTVTGTDVAVAERYLDRLTGRPYLTEADRSMDRERIGSTLSARIDRMRGVQSSFAAKEVKRLEALRDDDVTALQLKVALFGVCLLLAVGAGVTTARSLTRPLSVLTRGSKRLVDDPQSQEPISYTGRDDEFATVVRALNSLRSTAEQLHKRASAAETESEPLRGSVEELTAERDALRTEYRAAKARLEELSGATHGTFVNLGMRTLGLVERQLAVIEGLEASEADPDQLRHLFALDHLATRMRRHSENLLLLAGAEHTGGHHQGPVPLLDVLRAAVSEIERYERVELGSLPPHIQVSGFAADDISHLVAELLDNASAFSPPEVEVRLSGWLLENGEVMLSVQDEGIGVADDRLAELNERLGDPESQEPPEPGTESASPPGTVAGVPSGGEGGRLGMGLYVVARLAARHRLRVELRKQRNGGMAAVVVVPHRLLPDRPAPGVAQPREQQGTALPGSAAEANSNALPSRRAVRTGTEPVAEEEPAGEETAPAASDDEHERPDADTTQGTGAAPLTAPARTSDADEATHEHVGDSAPVPSGTRGAAADPPAADEDARPDGDLDAGTGVDEPATPGANEPSTAGQGENEPKVPQQRRTAKGLPKRTPKISAPAHAPEDTTRSSGANADELRRRLGGFQRGAKEGLRAAEAQIAEETADRTAEEEADRRAGAQGDGGTAEEARK